MNTPPPLAATTGRRSSAGRRAPGAGHGGPGREVRPRGARPAVSFRIDITVVRHRHITADRQRVAGSVDSHQLHPGVREVNGGSVDRARRFVVPAVSVRDGLGEGWTADGDLVMGATCADRPHRAPGGPDRRELPRGRSARPGVVLVAASVQPAPRPAGARADGGVDLAGWTPPPGAGVPGHRAGRPVALSPSRRPQRAGLTGGWSATSASPPSRRCARFLRNPGNPGPAHRNDPGPRGFPDRSLARAEAESGSRQPARAPWSGADAIEARVSRPAGAAGPGCPAATSPTTAWPPTAAASSEDGGCR